MGNWNLTVVGVGAHHNADYPKDANRLAKQFVDTLTAAGHTVQHASLVFGGVEHLTPSASIEELAKALHDSAREAVEKGQVINKAPGPFLGWEEITEEAREGRRIMARFLLARYNITPK